MAAAVPPPFDITLLVEDVKTASRETFKSTLIRIMDQGEFKGIFSFIDTFDSRKNKFLEALSQAKYLKLCHAILKKEYEFESKASSEFHPTPLSRNTKASPNLRGVCYYILIQAEPTKTAALTTVERGMLIQAADVLRDTALASTILEAECLQDCTTEPDSCCHPINMYCTLGISDTLRKLCSSVIVKHLFSSDPAALEKNEGVGGGAAASTATLAERKKNELIENALKYADIQLIQCMVKENSLNFLTPEAYLSAMDNIQDAKTLGLLYRYRPGSMMRDDAINEKITRWLREYHRMPTQLQTSLETFLDAIGPSCVQLITGKFLVDTYKHCNTSLQIWVKLFLQHLQKGLRGSCEGRLDSEESISSEVHARFSPLFHTLLSPVDDAETYMFLLNEKQCGFKFNLLDLQPVTFSGGKLKCPVFDYTFSSSADRIFSAMLKDPFFSKIRPFIFSIFLPEQYLQRPRLEEHVGRDTYSKFTVSLLDYFNRDSQQNILFIFINANDLFDPIAMAYCVEKYLELHLPAEAERPHASPIEGKKITQKMTDRICRLIASGQVDSTASSLFDLAKKHFPTIADALEKCHEAASGGGNDDFAVLIQAATRASQRMRDTQRRADILKLQRTTVDNGLAKLEEDCLAGKITPEYVLRRVRELRAELTECVVDPLVLGEPVYDCFAVANAWRDSTVVEKGCSVVVGERSGGGGSGGGYEVVEPRG